MAENKSKMKVPFFQVPNSVFDSDLELSTYEKLTLVYLFRCSNQGSMAYPSLFTIANKTGMSKRKVSLVLDSLIQKQLLIKEPRSGKSNIYRLLHDVQGLHDVLWSDVQGLHDVQGSIAPDATVLLHDVQPIKNYIKKEPDKKKKEKDNALNELIGLYITFFKENTGSDPHIKRGQDHKLLKEIITSRGLEEAKELMKLYFETADDFTISKQGYSIGFFSKSINKLIANRNGGSIPANVKTALKFVEKYSEDDPPGEEIEKARKEFFDFVKSKGNSI